MFTYEHTYTHISKKKKNVGQRFRRGGKSEFR